MIEADPRIRSSGAQIALALDAHGAVTLDGEVANVAAKRLALDRAAHLPDVITVVDRLRVAPVRRFSDDQIRRQLLDLYVDEPEFSDYDLVSALQREHAKRRTTAKPHIELQAEDGIVTLRGAAKGLLHKRLAGVFAWWTPGTRDVLNLVDLPPSTVDTDDQIEEAVRLALHKDPLISTPADVSVRHAVVSLRGSVANAEERDAAEADAWYVFGVRDVVNSIELHG